MFLLFVLGACGAKDLPEPKVAASAPPRAAIAPRGVAECPLEGAFPIASGEKLRMGEVEASFTGHLVGVRVESFDTKAGVANVTVRTPAKSPALRLDGTLHLGVLPLRAARDVRIAGDHVVIPRGTPVVVRGGDGAVLGIEPRYGDFADVEAIGSCDDVALVLDITHQPDKSRPSYMHVTKPRVTLFASPDGAPIIELGVRHARQATVHVIESRGAFRHVRYEDGVRIDAWMRAADLAPGEGPDCDDCHGWPMDAEDGCDPAKDCPDEKGGPFHASHKVAVRDRPSPEGQPLGWLEEDGEVRIVGRQGTYARVVPVTHDIAPPAGGFWIDEGILRPKGE